MLVFSCRATEGPCGVKNCWGGGEPNPAGAEAWLSVIRQGSHLSAKRGEDTKVRRVVPNEQAWTGTLHKRVCTDALM